MNDAQTGEYYAGNLNHTLTYSVIKLKIPYGMTLGYFCASYFLTIPKPGQNPVEVIRWLSQKINPFSRIRMPKGQTV